MPKYQIFLSHHDSDTALAQNIHKFLGRNSHKIVVETYVHQTQPDADYRRWINTYVRKADMFMFLYTDDKRELSWVGHELGLFLGIHDKKPKDQISSSPSDKEPGDKAYPHKVVCIKSSDIGAMPAIMSHISPIPATAEKIKEFLEDLLTKGKYTNDEILANDVGDDLRKEINAGAIKLAGMFTSKIHTEYFADRLIFTDISKNPLSDFQDQDISPDFHVVRSEYSPQERTEKEWVLDFSDVKIETNDSLRKDLRLHPDCCWGDLMHLARKSQEGGFGPSDRFNLPQEILDHASSGIVKEATSMMLSEIQIEGKIFLPIISRVETQDRLPISYYLIMLPDPKSRPEKIVGNPVLMEAFTKDLKLILLLKAARRFRWNVLEPFIWEIQRAIHAKEALQPIFFRLQTALDIIERDGEQDKIDDGNLAALEFPIGEREDLQKLWLEYAALRVEINNAIKNNNTKSVLEILNKFQEMNRSFFATSLEVYKQLMIDIPTLDEASENWRDEYFR